MREPYPNNQPAAAVRPGAFENSNKKIGPNDLSNFEKFSKI
jgi:hypothetical protein